MESIYLVNNAALEEFELRGGLPHYGQFYELAGDELGEGHTTLTPAFRVEIQRNPSLRRLAMPGWPLEVQYLTIEDNPALTDIDLSATERVDFLSLTRNATLAHLSLPSLRTVDALKVVDNPQLSPSAFASVKTF